MTSRSTKIINEALSPNHVMTQEKDEDVVGIDEGNRCQVNKDRQTRSEEFMKILWVFLMD